MSTQLTAAAGEPSQLPLTSILKKPCKETQSDAAEKSVAVATQTNQVFVQDASTVYEDQNPGVKEKKPEMSVQTVLKGWLTADMDVSVQQSNGSFKVQSLNIDAADDDKVYKPLRMWFPSQGVEATVQTDVKGWTDSHMDVITQGEDGSFYLKKSCEHASLESDLVYRPYRVHRATQAKWVGNQTFHMATQTNWDGSSTFHKATQFPDSSVSEDHMGQSVLYSLDKGCPVGLVPATNPFSPEPTVTSLIATLGLPPTDDDMTRNNTPSVTIERKLSNTTTVAQPSTTITSAVSSSSSAAASGSNNSQGVQPMDLDTDHISTSDAAFSTAGKTILANTAVTSSVPATQEGGEAVAGGLLATAASTIVSAAPGGVPLMSFAGYNPLVQAHGMLPPPPAGSNFAAAATFPVQPAVTYLHPAYPAPPAAGLQAYNFYPTWL